MRSAILLLLPCALGCADLTPLQRDHQALVGVMTELEATRYALECAPKAFAMAQAHRHFAEVEFEEGDITRAAEHLEIARRYAEEARKAAQACIPKDVDGDGIPDSDDACPTEPEDMDGDRDDDGCPEEPEVAAPPPLPLPPPPAPGDMDGDGIVDSVDECPDVPEDLDSFKDADGCPELDNDADGIVDGMDACPMAAEDFDGFMDADGCPDLDNDNDGLLDTADRCPTEPEDLDGDRDSDGCPDVDADGDGIPDDSDACPNAPETINQYMDEDGCPDQKPSRIEVTKQQIVIKEQIQFETGKATIRPVSYPVLDDVVQVLKDYPEIKVRIEGHTDSDGPDAANLELSKRRADAVFEYVIAKGIDARRLITQGFGETRPIDTNTTAAGKQRNRRVEFHILDKDGKDVQP
jgi:outer membrane protein OmpA-like peptidoglycan-associated protein